MRSRETSQRLFLTVTISRNTLNCERKNMKKTTLEHLIVKLIKAEVKENILKQPKKSYRKVKFKGIQ